MCIHMLYPPSIKNRPHLATNGTPLFGGQKSSLLEQLPPATSTEQQRTRGLLAHAEVTTKRQRSPSSVRRS